MRPLLATSLTAHVSLKAVFVFLLGHAGRVRTLRKTLLLLEEDRTMTTCTGCTCPVFTAAAVATAVRPAFLQRRTPSATPPLQSTCKLRLVPTHSTLIVGFKPLTRYLFIFKLLITADIGELAPLWSSQQCEHQRVLHRAQ